MKILLTLNKLKYIKSYLVFIKKYRDGFLRLYVLASLLALVFLICITGIDYYNFFSNKEFKKNRFINSRANQSEFYNRMTFQFDLSIGVCNETAKGFIKSLEEDGIVLASNDSVKHGIIYYETFPLNANAIKAEGDFIEYIYTDKPNNPMDRLFSYKKYSYPNKTETKIVTKENELLKNKYYNKHKENWLQCAKETIQKSSNNKLMAITLLFFAGLLVSVLYFPILIILTSIIIWFIINILIQIKKPIDWIFAGFRE